MNFLVWVVVSLSAGLIGSRFKPGAWYADLVKPSWNPPNWIFAPVWISLYIMMGVAAGLVWKEGAEKRALPVGLFFTQLLLNAAWSWLFFGLHQIGWALFEIGLLWILVLATMGQFFKLNAGAGLLLAPYFLWVSFAAILNLAIWRLNK